jgi:ABC-type multidrug transport system ATPase subunit
MAAGVQALVARLAADSRTTVVLATHNLDEAERICHRVAVLLEGGVRAVLEVGGRDQGLASQYSAVIKVG